MIDPDEIARAARRLGAKMVADQAADLMLSFVGLTGDPNDPEPTARTAMVVVARGSSAVTLMDWLDRGGGPPSSVVWHVFDGGEAP